MGSQSFNRTFCYISNFELIFSDTFSNPIPKIFHGYPDMYPDSTQKKIQTDIPIFSISLEGPNLAHNPILQCYHFDVRTQNEKVQQFQMNLIIISIKTIVFNAF